MKFNNPSILCYVLFITTALSSCTDATAPAATMEVTSPYIRALLPGKDRTAAFLQLTNHHPTACHFTGGQAAFAKVIELHQHSHHRGVMQMRKIDQLPIEPGQSVTLAPGGYHLMIMGVTEPLQEASEIELQLTFSDCPAVTTHAKVVSVFDE